jgi:twinkle protein
VKTWADFNIELRGNASGEVSTTCPQCSHQRKKKNARCLSVNVDEGVWFCQHCAWAGTLKDGVRKTDIHWARPTYRKPDPAKLPKSDLPSKVIEWFAKRGITEDVLVRNKIGAGSVYMPQVEGHANAISFPYYRDGELVNIKWRDGQKNFRLETGAERIPFGLDDVEPGEVWIWVEGECDKLALEVVGFLNVVSVPTGAPSPDAKDYSSKFDFLENCQAKIASAKSHIIAVDADEPGKVLEDELARRLGREKCFRVVWPEGCKDANESLLKAGAGDTANAVGNAQPFPVKGVFDVLDLSDRIDSLYASGYERGVSTGWRMLDDLYTARPGEFTVVTGIPNSGKSNWLDALAVNLARAHGWRFAIFSPENQPLEDHMARVMEKWAQEPFNDGPTRRMSAETKDAAKQWVGAHFSWILPDDDGEWTLEHVLDAARALVFRKGIRGLVIDPWNELEHNRPAHMSETEHVSACLKKIRQWGRRYGVHVWIVAHPQKLYKDKDGNYPVPTPYDISGSAHWRNKADNCLTIWRDFQEAGAVEIHVQKIRFRQIGKVGMAKLGYAKVCATYYDLRDYADRYKEGIPV